MLTFSVGVFVSRTDAKWARIGVSQLAVDAHGHRCGVSRKALEDDPIETMPSAGSVTFGAEDVGVSQDAKVFRDRGLCQRQLCGDLPDGMGFALHEVLDDLNSRRMAHRLGDRGYLFSTEPFRIDRRIVVEAGRRWLGLHAGQRIKRCPSRLGAERPYIADGRLRGLRFVCEPAGS